jgi:type III secretion protein L
MVDLVRLSAGRAAPLGPGRILKADAVELVGDLEQLRAEARREAAALVQAASDEAEAIRNAAREAGLAEATAEIQDRLFEIAEASANVIARTEQRIVELGLQIARRVIGSFEETEVTARIARQTLKLAGHSGFVRLRVAPSSVDALRERVDSLLPAATSNSGIEVIGDTRIAPGGCVMETDAGLVDATIDSQIAAIERGLRRSVAETEDRA